MTKTKVDSESQNQQEAEFMFTDISGGATVAGIKK